MRCTTGLAPHGVGLVLSYGPLVATGEEEKKVADMSPLHVSHVSILYKRIEKPCKADTWRGGGGMRWGDIAIMVGTGHVKADTG